MPDRKWRDEGYAKYADVRREGGLQTRHDGRAATSAAASSATWTGGDNVNLAVGQGDLQATPLQVAVAYAALANGGTIVTPAPRQGDRGRQRRHAAGVPHQAPPQDQDRPSATATAVLDGLRRAAQEEEGTSADVFKGWPMDEYPVYGKTGTAERQPEPRPGVVRLLRQGQGDARSSSSSPSRRAASARPPRHPRRA